MIQGKVGRKYGHPYYKDNDIKPMRIRSSWTFAPNDNKKVIGDFIVQEHSMGMVKEKMLWKQKQQRIKRKSLAKRGKVTLIIFKERMTYRKWSLRNS